MESSALQKSMEMAMTICRIESEDELTTREREKKEVDWFAFLPDDIISDILKRLPEPFLDYKAKYVCRRWLDVINNRIFVDRASFIHQKTTNLTAVHVDIREEGEGLQVKVMKDLDIPHIGMIRSWGNEFLLISDYKKRSMYVYNLMTKKGSYLPECNTSCGGYCTIKCGVAISFDVFKGIYKVVHLYIGPPIECHILILREDVVSSKWKKIQVPCMNEDWSFSYNPVSVQGRYFHWDVRGDNYYIVSMDMVKEEIVDMLLPVPGTIFEMDGSLALFARATDHKTEIWILKDFQKKEWEKLHSVTLENWYYKRLPVCAVMSNKYIIMECKYDNVICYYDLKNGVEKKLDIHTYNDDGCVVHLSPPRFKQFNTIAHRREDKLIMLK